MKGDPDELHDSMVLCYTYPKGGYWEVTLKADTGEVPVVLD